jgi:hypothetical protein
MPSDVNIPLMCVELSCSCHQHMPSFLVLAIQLSPTYTERNDRTEPTPPWAHLMPSPQPPPFLHCSSILLGTETCHTPDMHMKPGRKSERSNAPNSPHTSHATRTQTMPTQKAGNLPHAMVGCPATPCQKGGHSKWASDDVMGWPHCCSAARQHSWQHNGSKLSWPVLSGCVSPNLLNSQGLSGLS